MEITIKKVDEKMNMYIPIDYLLIRVYNGHHQYDLLEDYDEVLPLNLDSIHKHKHDVHDHEQETEE
jgi:hypothetical protein